MFQRFDIVVIRDVRQSHHHDIELLFGGSTACHPCFERYRILVGNTEVLDIGHHAQHRLAGALSEKIEPRCQQRQIASKLIYDEGCDPGPLILLQQFHRPDKRGEDAAPVDVPHEEHRRVRQLGYIHVDDVAILQIDLSRTPSPFDYNEVIVRSKARERFLDHRHEARFIVVILHRAHAADRFALHHDLAAPIAFRLEQDRIHVHG